MKEGNFCSALCRSEPFPGCFPIAVSLTVRTLASTHGASLFFDAETSLCSNNIVEKLQTPERQLSDGKLEDEEMDLGQVPVCQQCFHQSVFHLPFLWYGFIPI